jgi:hypothetical protein
MGLFKRRRGGEAADPYLPFLTVDQADRIRALAQEGFAGQGRAVAVSGDHVIDDSGMNFGLRNVAARCRNDDGGEAAWSAIVADHVRRVHAMAVAAERDVLADRTAGQVQSQTYAVLWAANPGIVSSGSYEYAREILPGVLEMLAYDMPESFRMLTDQDIERFGGLTALREAGLANLRALPAEPAERRTAASGGHFDVLTSESVYTASRALVLDDVAGQLPGEADAGNGVFACVPNRHQLAVHVPGDESVILSVTEMAHFGLAGYSDGPGPLSPSVFWWRNGRWEQLSEVRNGQVGVQLSDELFSMIARVRGE